MGQDISNCASSRSSKLPKTSTEEEAYGFGLSESTCSDQTPQSSRPVSSNTFSDQINKLQKSVSQKLEKLAEQAPSFRPSDQVPSLLAGYRTLLRRRGSRRRRERVTETKSQLIQRVQEDVTLDKALSLTSTRSDLGPFEIDFSDYDGKMPRRYPSDGILALRTPNNEGRLRPQKIRQPGSGTKSQKLSRNVSVTVEEDDDTITTKVQIEKIPSTKATITEIFEEAEEELNELLAIEDKTKNPSGDLNSNYIKRGKILKHCHSETMITLANIKRPIIHKSFSLSEKRLTEESDVSFTEPETDNSSLQTTEEELEPQGSSSLSLKKSEKECDVDSVSTEKSDDSRREIRILDNLLKSLSACSATEQSTVSKDTGYSADVSSKESPCVSQQPSFRITPDQSIKLSPELQHTCTDSLHGLMVDTTNTTVETSSLDDYATANESIEQHDNDTDPKHHRLILKLNSPTLRSKMASFPRAITDTLSFTAPPIQLYLPSNNSRRSSFSSSSETEGSLSDADICFSGKAPPKPPRTFHYENWTHSNLPKYRRRWRQYRSKSAIDRIKPPIESIITQSDDPIEIDPILEKSHYPSTSDSSLQMAIKKSRLFLYNRIQGEEVIHILSILICYQMVPEGVDKKLKSMQGNGSRKKIQMLLDIFEQRSDSEIRFLLRYFHMNSIYLDVVTVVETIDALLKLSSHANMKTDFVSVEEQMINVREISIEVNALDQHGSILPIEAYRQVDHPKDLKPVIAVHIPGQNLGNIGATVVANIFQQHKSIYEIGLGNNNIGKEGIYQIANALFRNKSAIKLDLRLNPFGNKGVGYIANVLLSNSTLKELNLSHTGLNKEGMQELAKALLGSSPLSHLDLSYNDLGSDTYYIFAAILKATDRITCLRLRNVGFTEVNFQLLAEALVSNTGLRELDLSRNELGDFGAGLVANALIDNRRLDNLNLEGCAITDTGIKYLAQVLQQNITLTKLDLSSNNIGDSGSKLLAEALENINVLEVIALNSCQIGNIGFLHLLEGIQRNSSLVHVKLAYNMIGQSDGDTVDYAKLTQDVINSELTEVYINKPHLRIALWGNKM